MGNIGGTQNGHAFRILPDFIDSKKPPGFSTFPLPTFSDWIISTVTLKTLYASPNIIWLIIAILIYILFPYDLSPNSSAYNSPLSLQFFSDRLPLWLVVTLGYVTFWHITLFSLGWAERPFIQNRKYNWDKVIHNIFWNISGIIIWTGFENVFVFLWSNGKLPYLPDSIGFGSVKGLLHLVVGTILIPTWRDFHFYCAHRLLHFKPLFSYAHFLHHRNTDIEPFAGLSMHPVEHLYYYACIVPSLFYTSPFLFLWNGTHLLLSPAAAHSGWEDHIQGDGFHYMHHRYFECNYAGYGAAFLDAAFGTLMRQFKEKEGKVVPRDDAKSTLRGLPSMDFIIYLTLSAACVGLWAYTVTAVYDGTIKLSIMMVYLLSFMCGFGPVLVACAMTLFQRGISALLEPFQEKPLSESFLHIIIGSAFTAFPISYAAYLSYIE